MDVDRDAWEEEQLRLAIENSLADLNLKGAEEPPNEFASQDLAFFTDVAIRKVPDTTVGNEDYNKKALSDGFSTYVPSERSPPQPPTSPLSSTAGGFQIHNKNTKPERESDKESLGQGGGLFGRLVGLIGNNKDVGDGNAIQESKGGTTATAGAEYCRACRKPCTHSIFSAFGTTKAANGDLYHSDCFVCGTCHNPIRGQYLQHNSSDFPYHLGCFRCGGCNEQIVGNFKDYGEPPLPYHAECYKELFQPRCCLCTHTLEGRFYKHPFFESEIYCMSHESLPACFACGRKQPLPESHREGFADLMDGRSLCAQCSSSIIVDSSEAAALYQGIVEFMGRELGLSIPAEMRDVPVLVVDVQSLNENMNRKDSALGYHNAGESGAVAGQTTNPSTSTVRGLTLSTCCEVRHFPTGSLAFSQLAGALRSGQAPVLFTSSEVRAVTAVLVLYGLPKDLIASILAHEAMHVWLKLNKEFPFRMTPKLEEGLCQVIAYLYLESIRMFDTEEVAQMSQNDSKESTLRSYFSKQIEDDTSPVYGDGFREAYRAVKLLGLDIVLEYVQHHHQLPDIHG